MRAVVCFCEAKLAGTIALVCEVKPLASYYIFVRLPNGCDQLALLAKSNWDRALSCFANSSQAGAIISSGEVDLGASYFGFLREAHN